MSDIASPSQRSLSLEDFVSATDGKLFSASRLILSTNKEGATSLEQNVGSFCGVMVRWLTGTESKKNRAILNAFKQALQTNYGDQFTIDIAQEKEILKGGLKPFTIIKIILSADSAKRAPGTTARSDNKKSSDITTEKNSDQPITATMINPKTATPLSQAEGIAQNMLTGRYNSTSYGERMWATNTLKSNKALPEVKATPLVFADVISIDDRAVDNTNITNAKNPDKAPLIAADVRPYIPDAKLPAAGSSSPEALTAQQAARQDQYYQRVPVQLPKTLD